MAGRLLWDPWREISAMERQLEQVLGRQRQGTGPSAWGPALEAFHTKDDLVVRIDLPGVRPEDVELSVHENVLVVTGERHFEEDGVEDGAFLRRERGYGHFERQVLLAEGIDVKAITADFDLGVLTIRIPHPKAKQPTRVKITLGGSADATPATVEAIGTEKPATESENSAS